MITVVFKFVADLVSAHWRVIAIAAGVVLVIGLTIGFFRSCARARIKIDQESINKINSANEAERKKELQKIIEDNASVVQTVDNRSALAETNVVERNREVDERVRAANAKIEAAKRVNGHVTSEELECILVPENCSQP
ncbi:MAG: hypothetical protein ABI539_11655 [Acidobacteriota bacterium]